MVVMIEISVVLEEVQAQELELQLKDVQLADQAVAVIEDRLENNFKVN
jgi:hypothetical protein